jgi:hypothetical protein
VFSGLNSQNPNPLACCYRFWADLSLLFAFPKVNGFHDPEGAAAGNALLPLLKTIFLTGRRM